MSYQNANTIEEGASLDYDVCIIGSGAAGIAVAKEFSDSNVSVIMLEAGGIDYEHEMQTDYTYNAINGMEGEWDFTRTRQWGGTTAVWYGRCTKLKPIDYEKRDWVANSGWPIGPAEIDKYHGRALSTLKVSHPQAINPCYWGESETVKAFDSEEVSANVFLWSNPKDMAVAHQQNIGQSKAVTLCYYAFVQQIIPSENDDHIDSVQVKSASGKAFSIRAKQVVLAGGSIENCRLLLLSKTNGPNGVGNQNDNVGRYYMDHPRIEGMAKLMVNFENKNWATLVQHLDETITDAGNMQVFLSLSEKAQKANRLLNHGTVFRTIFKEQISSGYLAAKNLYYSAIGKTEGGIKLQDVASLMKGLPHLAQTSVKQALGKPLTFSHLILIDQLEQEPDRESRIYLDSERDRFDQPKTQIKWEIGQSTTDSLREFHKAIDKRLREINLGWVDSPMISDPDFVPDYTDACHPSGTTRMSSDPKTGVVDADCKVHGIDNLFIAGSSVFPTVGYANPTLTLVALGIRLADKIKSNLMVDLTPTVIKERV